MRSLVFAALAALSLIALARAADAPMAPLEFFQGCWRGEFVGQPGITDERCFTPMLGGRYVRDTHQVRGAAEPYGGETIYYRDAQASRLAYTYFAGDGSVMRGFADADASTLTFPEGQFVEANGETLTLRSVWRRDGEDRYEATTEMQQNGTWRTLMRIAYTRAPELAAPAH